MRLDFSKKPVQWITLLVLALVWGSSFILMKRGLEHFSSTEVAAFRMGLASLALLPIALNALKHLKGNTWNLFIAGLFGNALPAFLFAYAQTMIPSSLSGILNSLTSLWTLVFGILIFQTQTTRWQVGGVVIALVGAMGLIGFENIFRLADFAQGALIVLLATAMYGIAVNVIKSRLHHVPPVQLTSLAFMLTGPWCLVYLLSSTNFIGHIDAHPESLSGVGYIAILALVGTAMAVLIFNRMIKETSAVFASSVTYLIPVVALGWGMLDGEEVLFVHALYMLLILTGVFLMSGTMQRINRGPSNRS